MAKGALWGITAGRRLDEMDRQGDTAPNNSIKARHLPRPTLREAADQAARTHGTSLSRATTKTHRLSLDRENEARAQLRKHLPSNVERPGLAQVLQVMGAHAGTPAETALSDDDLSAALALVPQVRIDLDITEFRLLDLSLRRGMNFESIGRIYGMTRQGARQRYERLRAATAWMRV